MNTQVEYEAKEAKINPIVGSFTPLDLQIKSRNKHFAGIQISCRHWAGGDPYASAFFNALSASFPAGEAFFIATMKKFVKRVPPKLNREIGAFIQQEVVHSREHHCFNRQVEEANYDISRLEENIAGVVKRFKSLPHTQHLVATMCIEHLTAIISAEVIKNPSHMENAEAEQRNLWIWHASEEIEHKGVAFDTWLHITKKWSPLKRYVIRSLFMAKITLGFVKNRREGMLDLLEQDGITGWRAKFGIFKYAFFGKSAPARRTALPWLRWFKPHG